MDRFVFFVYTISGVLQAKAFLFFMGGFFCNRACFRPCVPVDHLKKSGSNIDQATGRKYTYPAVVARRSWCKSVPDDKMSACKERKEPAATAKDVTPSLLLLARRTMRTMTTAMTSI